MLSRAEFISQASMAIGGLMIPEWMQTKSGKMKQDNRYDVIIIGGSYAGLAAGMALGRALRRVLIIDSGKPCNRQTPHSHNFLTQDGTPPAEIARQARKQVEVYDTVEFLNDRAITGRKTAGGFVIELSTGKEFKARKLVFATGIKDEMPAIPGFAESWGISVLHCPYCHGYEVRQQPIGILANGEPAVELATLISNWTGNLTVYTNGTSTISREQAARFVKHGITINESVIKKIEQENGYIHNLVLRNGEKPPLKALYARLPFVQHSGIPASLGCEITPEGYIKTDPAQRTTVPGVFACGDSTSRMRTVANAVSSGTATGIMLNKELIEEAF
ncbi:MAG: NAD(P)/FAD-dependent oxidoreductase [Ferruginibacter sp.]